MPAPPSAKKSLRRIRTLLEQAFLRGSAAGDAEVTVRLRRRAPAASGSRDESFLEQVRLDDVLERFGVFGKRRGDRGDAGRAAAILFDDRAQERAIESIEPELVDAFARQRFVGDLGA